MSDSDYEMGDSDEDSDGSDTNWVESAPVGRTTVAFEVLDPTACLTLANQQIAQICNLLCCTPEIASILLRQFRWDGERLTTDYLDDPDTVLRKAGFHQGEDQGIIHDAAGLVHVSGQPQPASSLPEIKCLICYEDTRAYSALTCGHKYCNVCYTTFLSHKIKDEGHACLYTTCPHDKCPVMITERLVNSLPLSQEQRGQYSKAGRLERSYVDDNPNIKWCTAPDCSLALRAQRGTFGVKCSCGNRFCFSCGQEDHTPCSCAELQKWVLKCKDDSETYNWLVSNTKACPKCATSIEKNGGCNHMTCKNTSCKYEFCWVCLGAWKDHSGSYYSCNKYDPEKDKETPEGKKKDSAHAALERYLHYYTRFTGHHNSLKLEEQAKIKMEAKIKEMEQLKDNTWMDCQYLIEANDSLYECRYALQYTYVYAYYLPEKGNYRTHFEMQQAELERQTEELAELLERDVQEIKRMQVVQSFQMAKKRLKNLLEIVTTEQQKEGGSSSSS